MSLLVVETGLMMVEQVTLFLSDTAVKPV